MRYGLAALGAAAIAGTSVASCGSDGADESIGLVPDGRDDGAEARVTEAAQPLVEVCATLRRGVSGVVTDTQLASDDGKAIKNYGAGLALNTGKVGVGDRQSLVRFDLGAIPAGAAITSATMTLTAREANVATVNAHAVHAPWSEGAVTWSSFYASPAPQFVAAPAASAASALGAMEFDLTDLVSTWASGATPNHGVLLEQSGFYFTNFATSEDLLPSARPKLEVCYLHDLCTGVVCPAPDACHLAGTCDPATGQCNSPPKANGAPCDDGNACTQGDTCQSGACTGGAPLGCDDGDPCTTDGCDPLTGCVHAGMCPQTSCVDKVKNGAETDVDCGGPTCPTCADTKQCLANTDCQSGTCKNGVCAPAAAACVGGPANPATGQRCPLFAPCTQFSDCGVFQGCQQWFCNNGGTCELNALSSCWTNVGGGCNANVVFTQQTLPPVAKDFVPPDGVNFREVASLAFTVQNNTGSDLYLDKVPLTIEVLGGGSKFDVSTVKMFDDSGGTEHGVGDIFMCLTANPFSFPANGVLGPCAGSSFSKITKNGGTNRFIINLAFDKDKTFITGRSYRLSIPSASGIVFKNGFNGPTFAGTTCGIPAAGFTGAWVTAKKP